MTPSNDRSAVERSNDYAVRPGSLVTTRYLEMAQRIARESLEADHQALELDGKRAPETRKKQP